MRKLHLLTWAFALLCLYSCKKDKKTEAEAVQQESLATESGPSGGYSVINYNINTDPHLVPVDTANKMIRSYLKSVENDDEMLHSLVINAETIRQYLKDSSIKEVKIMFAHTLNYINSGHEGQSSGLKSNALTVVLAGYKSDGTFVVLPGDKIINKARPCPTSCPPYGDASNDILP